MPAKTSAASANCGTHPGLTNADTSIAGRLAAVSRLTNSILSAVEIAACSFCRPSRGPTSTMVTRRPRRVVRFTALHEIYQSRFGLHEIAVAAVHSSDSGVGWGAYRQLHLHRFENDDGVALFHRRAWLHEDSNDRCRHRRRERLGGLAARRAWTARRRRRKT